MKLSGKFPDKGGKSFDELLEVCRRPPPYPSSRLLRTIYSTGFVADGIIVSKMALSEKSKIAKLHAKFSEQEEYRGATPFDLDSKLPKSLSEVVITATYLGKPKTMQLVLLRSDSGLETLVELDNFLTLNERHPTADWWFARGTYWEKPLVLLGSPEEGLGLEEREFLGLMVPVKIKDAVGITKKLPKTLVKVDKELRYERK